MFPCHQSPSSGGITYVKKPSILCVPLSLIFIVKAIPYNKPIEVLYSPLFFVRISFSSDCDIVHFGNLYNTRLVLWHIKFFVFFFVIKSHFVRSTCNIFFCLFCVLRWTKWSWWQWYQAQRIIKSFCWKLPYNNRNAPTPQKTTHRPNKWRIASSL